MKTPHTFLPVLLLLTLWCSYGVAHAADAPTRETVGTSGYIDWQEMRAVATGTGIPPLNADQTQEQLQGMRAATMDARRNLLDVVRSVRLDASTQVGGVMLQNESIAAQVQGFVQGAQVERSWVTPDGLYHVTVTMPLTGAFGRMLLDTEGITGHQKQEHAQQEQQNIPFATRQRMEALERKIADLSLQVAELRATQQALNARFASSPGTTTGIHTIGKPVGKTGAAAKNESGKSGSKTDSSGKQGQSLQAGPATLPNETTVPEYTGLVIDARDLGFTPSLHPELYDADGIIFPSAGLNPQTAATDGLVRYMDSIPAAQQAPRAGSLPYTIKATGTTGGNPAKLNISAEDAAILRSILTRENNFLDNCKVVIVF